MVDLKAVGRRVATLRRASPRRLTQDILAAEIGMSRSAIAGIETGGDRGGILAMVAVADYFKVPMDWLLCRTVPPGGPLVGQFVDDPDKLALLDFWEGLSEDERATALRLLHIQRDRGAA